MVKYSSQLFESAVVIIEMLTLYMYLSGIFPRKMRSKLYDILAYSILCVALGLASIFMPNMILLASVTFVGILCLARFIYDSHILSIFYATLLYLLLVIAIDAIVPALYSWAFEAELTSIRKFGAERIFATIIVKLVVLLFVRIITIIMEKHRDSLQRKMLQSIPLIICQIILIILIAVIFIRSYDEGGNLTQTAFLEIVGLFIVDMVILWYYKLVINIYDLRHQNELAAIQLENQVKHYDLVKSHQETINAIEHDMRNHIQVLGRMAASGQEHEVSEYLARFSDTMNENMGLVFTPHPMVSSILSYCRQRAQKACVNLKLDVAVSSNVDINQIDLTVILGNTIDNALEALDKIASGPRNLHISLKQSDYFLYYEISNSCDMNASKKHIKSKSLHGYGLKNVTNSVNKYGGNIIIRDNSTEYSTTIMIPCQTKKQE